MSEYLEGILTLILVIVVACLPFIMFVIKRHMESKLLKEYAESRPIPVYNKTDEE